MPRICYTCAKEPHLKKLILLDGSLGQCTICEENAKSCNVEENRFFQLCKALVRLHYSEWDYNTHWGGDHYESLFLRNDNIFFNVNRAVNEDALDEAIQGIVAGSVYEEYDKGISVFSGYHEGHPAGILQAIKTYRTHELTSLTEALRKKNYFFVEPELLKILRPYIGKTDKALTQGYEFYRARIGFKEQKSEFLSPFRGQKHFSPFQDSEIGAPPPTKSIGGRLNRAGVSFLYAATNISTAIAEIRPHPGDHISIGKFSLTKNAKLFDLSESQFLNYFETDEKLDDYLHLNTIIQFIHQTITPTERDHFTITQLIADCIRQFEYDGIMFNSTVGDGVNIVLFDSSIAQYKEDDKCVIEVTTVKYDYINKELISSDGTYYEDIQKKLIASKFNLQFSRDNTKT